MRHGRGSMLVFVCVSFMTLCMMVLVGLSFGGLFFVHNRLQSSAEEIALAGAVKLNEHDRIGQMNHMVARCRQLVFSSRDQLEETKLKFKDLEPFAQPFLDEGRDSAQSLEKERQKMTAVGESEARTAMQKKFDEIKSTYAIALPWLDIAQPQIKNIDFGKLDGMESNVKEMTELDKLTKDDQQRGDLVVNYPAMKVYKAEKNHNLRTTDSDLMFKLSSLSPMIQGQAAAARVILPQDFKDRAPGYAASTAKISLACSVQTKLVFSSKSTMESTGYAATSGGGMQL